MPPAQSCASLHLMVPHPFPFHDQTLHALPSGALHWPAQHVLTVSDLHLGKSRRLARRGGTLLPPYEVADTLARLDADIAATRPRTVICLGDSFDDGDSPQELDQPHRLWLARLMDGRCWVWIAGNHDPSPPGLRGTHRTSLALPPLTFRHIAEPGCTGEISGHYHPKARLAGRNRPCFLVDEARVILPAYGTYTGGLAASDPALRSLFSAKARAILIGAPPLAIPFQGTAA